MSIKVGNNGGFLTYEGAALKRETCYIVCPYGIGDTLYAAALVGSLKSYRINGRKVCLIVKKHHSQIPDWFEAVDEKIVSDEMVKELHMYSVAAGIWELNNYLYGHFRKNTDLSLFPEYNDCEVKNMIYRYKKLVFHLPPEAALEEPRIIPAEHIVEEAVETYGIGKETIILMPYAQSAGLMSAVFWELAAELFREMGYRVFTNVNGEGELPINGTQAISADLASMAALCEMSRLVLSLRSGLCDVLAFTETNLVVLNTSTYHMKEWNLKEVSDREKIRNFQVEKDTSIRDIMLPILELLEEEKG